MYVIITCTQGCINFSFTVIVEDFTVDLSTLNQIFSSGSTSNGDSVCINIGIVEDDIYEEDQQFNVRIASLSPSTAANSASPDSVSITIQDNDGLYDHSIEAG